MVVSRMKGTVRAELRQVWDFVLAVENYATWRSDLQKAAFIQEKQFVEVTKEGYSTTFTVTAQEPYTRWAFDMENSSLKGHWTGLFTAKGEETEIDFTEEVEPKKWYMRPFVKAFLRKQQALFLADLKKALES